MNIEPKSSTELDLTNTVLADVLSLSYLKMKLEVNVGWLCEPILKKGGNPKEDPLNVMRYF